MIEDLENSKDKVLKDLAEENEKLRDVLWSFVATFHAYQNVDRVIDPKQFPALMQRARDTLHPTSEVKT